MSSGAADAPVRPPAEWDRLELGVRRLLDAFDQCRNRADAAERRVAELEAALNEISAGRLDPVALTGRIDELEAENRALQERIEQAYARVERILARLRFLEEDQ